MKEKSLTINAFLNGIRNILNLIFPLITFPYVSHVLTVNDMGNYNFSSTYVGYFLLIAGLGISTYAVREGAKYRDNYNKISEFASQIFTINIVSTVLSYFLLAITLILFRNLRVYVICILIFSIQIIFTTIGTEWIYTIYEDYAYITIRSILFKIISIGMLFMFVKKPGDYLAYAAITVFASVGSNILNYIHAKKICSIKIIHNFNWKQHLKPILIIFSSAIAVNIYANSNVTILGLIKGNFAVGIYSIAVKIYNISQSLLTSILLVTIPRLAMLYGKKRFNDYKHVLKKLIDTISVLTLPVSVGVIMLSKEIILIIAGKKYLSSSSALSIISLAIIFSIFSWILSDCVLIPTKREKYVLRSTLITATFNIVFNLLLIPIISYNGASLSIVMSEFLSMSLNYYFSRDIMKEIVLNKQTIKNTLTVLAGCLFIIIFCCFMNKLDIQLYIKVIFIVIGSAVGYFMILLLLGNQVVKNYLMYFKHAI